MDYVTQRLDFLRSSQNSDGGWGYFPGKQSWLEPTVYATLTLCRDSRSAAQVRRAWGLVRSWQNPDGGWRPCQVAAQSAWGTALAVTLADVLGQHGPPVQRGARWLMNSAGAESSTFNRVLRLLHVSAIEREVRDAGWPWRPGTSAWVEPTAHSLVALRKLTHRKPDQMMTTRLEEGERMLLQVQCADGGWNYGSPRALGVELPSYAETSALALIGLQQRAPAKVLEQARNALHAPATSGWARAWLRIALGIRAAESPPSPPPRDILLCAAEALDADLLLPGART